MLSSWAEKNSRRGKAALSDMEGKSQEDIPLNNLLTVLRQKIFQD